MIKDNDALKKLRYKWRLKRIQALLEIIQEISLNKNSCSILDLGGTRAYWDLVDDEFLEAHNITIVLLNIRGQEKEEGRFQTVIGDACELQDFEDNQFDIVHSNSVIEHVGDWNRMVIFANEVRRLAPHYFIQTPNYWFPVEPHCMTLFFHWLPRPIRVAMVRRFNLGNWNKQSDVIDAVRLVESARLLDSGMLSALFEDGRIEREKFMLLTKSLVAIK